MQQFAQGFLVSRIMSGLPYHPVNRTQMLALDRLLNEAKRIVTGLPSYTCLEALKSCGKLNNLSELVDMHNYTQETRLRASNAGRHKLMLLGYDVHTLPIFPNKTPPWEIKALTDGKPLPLNMDPNQRMRRLAYAKRHTTVASSLPLTKRIVYTDAALPADGTSDTCYVTAWLPIGHALMFFMQIPYCRRSGTRHACSANAVTMLPSAEFLRTAVSLETRTLIDWRALISPLR
ncbi:hypothetical protein HPB49_012556 [Dermacentor silvarum]|uniref:Uncharacterized protein n=1 Tax=Dermacentor silvarum TaxID=543639 RepID=A0ACB8C3P3_DERSI|nr:hypothetical protein HPB49_012556 [Dermacentor silvarum]